MTTKKRFVLPSILLFGVLISSCQVSKSSSSSKVSSSSPITYKVTFQNYDGTFLYGDVVAKGGTAQYRGAKNPTKDSDEEYDYIWTGWDKPLTDIQSNTTITATYANLTNQMEFVFSSFSSNSYYSVKRCHDIEGSIAVPNEYNDGKNGFYPVKGIGASAFSSCSKITSLTLPNSITMIADYAFLSCSSLTSLTIPSSVTSIGKAILEGCSSLASFNVDSENVTYHSNGNCLIDTKNKTLISGCQSSTIPSDGSVTILGEASFEGCQKLTTLSLPNSITSIRAQSFAGCSSLTSLFLPNVLAEIGDKAFSNCSSLASLPFPTSLTSIGNFAFNGCSSLKEIMIPSLVTSIGTNPFMGCTGISSITVEGNTHYETGARCLIETSSHSLIAGFSSAVVPSTVTSIAKYAFANSLLSTISLPSGLTSIATMAFRGCKELKYVVIPLGVTSIEESAFSSDDTNIFYEGSSIPDSWNKDWSLSNLGKIYYYTDIHSTRTDRWHYVNGIPTPWVQ